MVDSPYGHKKEKPEPQKEQETSSRDRRFEEKALEEVGPGEHKTFTEKGRSKEKQTSRESPVGGFRRLPTRGAWSALGRAIR